MDDHECEQDGFGYCLTCGEPVGPDEWDEADRQIAMRKDEDAFEYFERQREKE